MNNFSVLIFFDSQQPLTQFITLYFFQHFELISRIPYQPGFHLTSLVTCSHGFLCCLFLIFPTYKCESAQGSVIWLFAYLSKFISLVISSSVMALHTMYLPKFCSFPDLNSTLIYPTTCLISTRNSKLPFPSRYQASSWIYECGVQVWEGAKLHI